MVKKSKRSKNFYLIIYKRIQKGDYPKKIASDLHISKQSLNYYVSFLKQKQIIDRVPIYGKVYGWKILKALTDKELEKQVKERGKKKFSLGLRKKPRTNLHALQINFPILEGCIKDNDWKIKNKLNNWIPKYKGLNVLGGLTIRNNNNKSISIFAKTRDIKNLEEVDNLAFKIKAFVYDYFKKKHEVTLDIFNCETKNLNLATEDRTSEDMIRKGERFELDLHKLSEKIFPKDKIRAKSWIDGSPFNFSAETNDKEWKRNYLAMPFTIRDISSAMFLLQDYNKNLELHTKVQEAQLKNQKEQLKTQKKIQKLLRRLNNGNLRVWGFIQK